MSDLVRLFERLDDRIEHEIAKALRAYAQQLGRPVMQAPSLTQKTRKAIRDVIEQEGWVLYHWNGRGEGDPVGGDDDPQQPAPAAAALP